MTMQSFKKMFQIWQVLTEDLLNNFQVNTIESNIFTISIVIQFS